MKSGRDINLEIDAAITCEGCGQCCRYVGAPPFSRGLIGEDPYWDSLPRPLQSEVLEAERHSGGDGAIPGTPCIWFDESTERCRHYDLRPTICRNFEVGGADCLEHRKGSPF